MKKYVVIFTILFTQTRSNCQNVYDKEKIFKFDGIEFNTKVLVIDSNSTIKVTIYSKNNNDSIHTSIFKFDDLFLQSRIKLFNSIILLIDKQSHYYYDILTQKRYYTEIGNRYDENLGIGIYNPILENNILKILNYKLEIIDIIDIKKYLKYGENWNLWHDSDLKNGKIELLKFTPYGKPGKYKKVFYLYNIKTKKISTNTSKPSF
jgi:hypothetical protein